jgi:hypothetical protein
MRKILISTFLSSIVLILTICIFPRQSFAIVDPQTMPNNTFGIHIQNENDLEDAAELVNSTGGDWGYVTFVIRKDERDTKRWQQAFDTMRKLHLIPIIRTATIQQNGGWEKANPDEIDGWVSFFNSLNWVIENRYVIVGNEPNHAAEWGGEVNPEEYADYLYQFSKKLKDSSDEYFILPAGLDASAPNLNNHMDEAQYVKRMLDHNNNTFEYIDGWSSHSYPNPDFSGSKYASGRGTITTYSWELSMLKSLDVDKDLPIFITETGWAHNMDDTVLGYKKTRNVADDFIYAYLNAWDDERVVAITPFILNYQEPPFDKFSWKKKDGTFYDTYYAIQTLPKIIGEPAQKTEGEIVATLIPYVFSNGGYDYKLALVKNTGQSIWEKGSDIQINNSQVGKIHPYTILSDIEPGKTTMMVITKI